MGNAETENTESVEVKDTKDNALAEAMASLVTGENLQRYILGTKKNGTPRAIYDIVKDNKDEKKKKKKKKKNKKKKKHMEDIASLRYDLYVKSKKKKKKDKKKKKKDKVWHF
jgi:hypothetical protein